MKRSAILFALLVTSACLAQAPAEKPSFFFRDGDQPIVFLGDSITEQHMYTTLVETYVLTRFPSWKVTFRNVGWGGDTSWLVTRGEFSAGLKRDVLSLNPKAITIDFGMNDARGGEAAFPKYVEHMGKLAQQLKAAGVRVALVTPSPEERYEANQPAGSAYNLILKKFSDSVKDVAAKENVVFVDQYTPFIKVVEDGRKAGVLTATQSATRLIPDGVHPNWAGHLVMAASILKGLNAPALVSVAELDAAARKTTVNQGCSIEWMESDAGAIKFKRTDECLPWPITREAEMVMKVPGFTPLEDLSQYVLKVSGLTAANYELLIDDQSAGTFTKEALAGGVNLTMLAGGPIAAQTQKILLAVTEKNGLFFQRWRTVQLFAAPAWIDKAALEPSRAAEMARIDKIIAEKEQAIEALRKPAPHVFTLKPK
jgi:lysophospholipase L1-like esterase